MAPTGFTLIHPAPPSAQTHPLRHDRLVAWGTFATSQKHLVAKLVPSVDTVPQIFGRQIRQVRPPKTPNGQAQQFNRTIWAFTFEGLRSFTGAQPVEYTLIVEEHRGGATEVQTVQNVRYQPVFAELTIEYPLATDSPPGSFVTYGSTDETTLVATMTRGTTVYTGASTSDSRPPGFSFGFIIPATDPRDGWTLTVSADDGTSSSITPITLS